MLAIIAAMRFSSVCRVGPASAICAQASSTASAARSWRPSEPPRHGQEATIAGAIGAELAVVLQAKVEAANTQQLYPRAEPANRVTLRIGRGERAAARRCADEHRSYPPVAVRVVAQACGRERTQRPAFRQIDARTNLYGGSGDEGGLIHVSEGAGPLSLYDGEWVWMRSRSTYGRTYQS